MKQRLLVMNGQRIVQAEHDGMWKNQKVDKAGALKPGIYNLYTAQQADKTKKHEGLIVQVDSDSVYLQSGKNLVRHERTDFDTVPEIGSATSINYDEQGKAIVEAVILKRSRSLSR